MRHILLLALLLVLPSFAAAQESGTPVKWDIRYVNEHLLYQKGDEVNVIDVDLEWPDMLDYSDVKVLQTYLSKTLFAVTDSSFDTAYTKFKDRFGVPVTKQFESIPDDNKFCYTDCRLKELGYEHGRYISFDVFYTCTPARASSQKGDTITKLITYDIIKDKVMTLDDILRTGKIESGTFPASFIVELLSNSYVNIPNDVNYFNLEDAALTGDNVLIRGKFFENPDMLPFSSYIKVAGMESMLTKGLKTLLKQPIPLRKPVLTRQNSQWKGEPVYLSVDQTPEYKGGHAAMSQYISTNVAYSTEDATAGLQGKVVASFIVDKSGRIDDIRIIYPVSPTLDRETVRLIRMMPQWTPGSLGGNAVNVRLTMPLQFKLKQ